MEKKNTNFINLGTYRAEEAAILKQELEKQGVPVKSLYSGTGIGGDAYAEAYFSSRQLMIRACDFQFVERLKKKLNIEPIKYREKMPLPKFYAWAKYGLSKYFLIGLVVSWVGIIVTGILSSELGFLSDKTPFYFMIAFSAFFFLWLFAIGYNLYSRKKTGNGRDSKGD